MVMLQWETNPNLMQKLAKYIFHIFRARIEQSAPNAGYEAVLVLVYMRLLGLTYL